MECKNPTLSFPWPITDSAKGAEFTCTYTNPGGNTNYCPLISEIAKGPNLISFLLSALLLYIVITKILSDVYIIWFYDVTFFTSRTEEDYCAHDIHNSCAILCRRMKNECHNWIFQPTAFCSLLRSNNTQLQTFGRIRIQPLPCEYFIYMVKQKNRQLGIIKSNEH